MADNSEIIVGGGQAVKPDQATIDALVEKLMEKLQAREMIQEKIDALLAKYREMLPKWLTLTHKYITLYPLPTGNADYNRDYETIYTDNPVFEEVNWSAVDYPEERPDEYRFSRRLSNMKHYTDDPNYKFPDVDTTIEEEELHWTFNEETGEYEQVPRTMIYKADAAGIIDRYDQSTSFRLATFNHNDDIRKIFFLEIVWGYSGWEWHDYDLVIGIDPETEEPITETLKGGNLYKIKEIETVPHIIDGHRLYHINDFLNSQDKVTTIEEFNTIHIKAMNRAFKRLTRKYGINSITPLLLKIYQFPEVIEANDAFCNNKISVINNNTIELPKLVNVDGFYKWGEFIDGTTFRMNSLESFTNGFYWANFSQTDFNLGDILIGNSLRKVSDLHGLLEMALFYNAAEVSGYDKPVNTFTIDLSGSSLLATTEFNLSRLFYNLGTNYLTGGNSLPLQDKYFVFNLTLRGLTDLSSTFRRIMNNSRQGGQGSVVPGTYYTHTAANQIIVNFNNTENLIRNLDYSFAENTFIEQPPMIRKINGNYVLGWANDYTTENYIYYGCSFREGITYNFSPNQILNPNQGQFNNCTIRTKKVVDGAEVALPVSFSNADALQKVRFQNINFTETVLVNGVETTRSTGIPFPYNDDFCNFEDYQYNEDPTDVYRYINFSGSMFTELKANQRIYVTGDSFKSMFQGCSKIDFTGKNIIIDVSATTTNGNFNTFNGCTNMITTPKIVNSNIKVAYSLGDIINPMFANCPNLEYVDAEEMSVISLRDNACENINFSGSPNLQFLKMGDVKVGFNLRGCYNLDISTLSATLLRQTSFGLTEHSDNINIGLRIPLSVWNQLPSATQTYCEGLPGTIEKVD